ncbi:hypothetical protein TTHERM_00616690 (macronuclear) [Tetrahymena thermophila SB210]|uniref:Uncharacterized protein n=1 Tax=Tetrahymena thermophila (strain SB210) TaxID=312017 RepID=I7M3X8_TETTS|nr:hypothetical protein TTHERM_00616690 [Tetrahymena thermophila SB210]EAS04494.1 hypothetical protein TTHERM_00616690 [Tetrahymena thermophila SB210]|eukprot:XP_001024739.1 hypothetical protein TTHERM_00616690 [Tetrahymena thermophila SB210]
MGNSSLSKNLIKAQKKIKKIQKEMDILRDCLYDVTGVQKPYQQLPLEQEVDFILQNSYFREKDLQELLNLYERNILIRKKQIIAITNKLPIQEQSTQESMHDLQLPFGVQANIQQLQIK